MAGKKGKIKIDKDGPYLVSGGLPLDKESMVVGDEKEPEEWKKGPGFPPREDYSLCRCGKSETKPFCDGTHIEFKFDDGDDSLKT